MIACASDAARHDRLLDITGGDAAALAEIRTALDLIAAQDAPDLASALCLACHRDLLTDRNTNIPPGLPAVWATLGQVTRAEALATSITDPYRRAEALVRVAGALAGSRQHQQAEAIARSITDPGLQAVALARVAGALAGSRQHQQAEEIARSITNPGLQAEALARVGARSGTASAGRGDSPLHHRPVPAGGGPGAGGGGAGRSGAAPAGGGDRPLHHQSGPASGGPGTGSRSAGRIRADQQAEAVARSITNPGRRAEALARVAGALAGAGQHQQAEADALARVAGALAGAGQHQQAARVAGQAEAIARSITDPGRRADALARVADALAGSGDTHSACRVAAATCAAGRWTASATPVLLLDPSAFAPLARALDDRWRTQLSR